MFIPLIVHLRLQQQQISQSNFTEPDALVGWFGAMQAQDYPNVRLALALRLPNATDTAIASAIDAGKIIRTHILRPTWHLVAAEDIYWMLALSGPRVSQQIVGPLQRLGLTPEIFKKSHAVLEHSLLGGQQRTRTELVAALEKSGIKADPMQATHLMMQAELDGLICNGAMREKQFTYALLEERVPKRVSLARQDAVVQLVQRYFQSHGPATLQDFVWWSGLTLTDAKLGMEALKHEFIAETIDKQEYWMPANLPPVDPSANSVHLLPSFDEFLVAYKNRDASLNPAHKNAAITANGIFKPVVVIHGQVVGTWQRTLKKDHVLLEIRGFSDISLADKQVITAKAENLGRFLEMQTRVVYLA